ncbi:MAG TPA: bifunctional UDP-sugar hydrolase/5'-nucleotidase [Candidatus Saccharimonadaceae bacterium]|jgi:2',3'-cyclic-nucleotide 2'-phosphodiesterase (5'-nucleotidase family)|nr:bifunctional UDP-sugar hydrolase/5'-nucleotidase [Candidatus Saccharimonadaceae bacterium]
MIIRTSRLVCAAVVAALFVAGAARAATPRREAPRAPIQIELLYTSDVHGHIGRDEARFLSPEFPPMLGGGASAATYIHRVRDEAAVDSHRVLLFDSGDLFQGSPLGAATKGGAVIEYMNRMRYDAIALGNHDFDMGRDNTERLARMAAFPMLASNLFDSTTNARPTWVRDRVMLDAQGVRVAVLGYITEQTIEMSFERNVAGLEFRRIIDVMPGDVAKARADGADLVIVLLHHGLPYRTEMEPAYRELVAREARGQLRRRGMGALELAHAVPGIDLILSGHTHQGYDEPWEDPVTHTIVCEPYANGSSLGHLTLRVDPVTRRLIGYETHFDRGALLTLSEDEVWPDSAEARLIGAQTAEAERGLDVVAGRTTVTLSNGPAESALLGFVMADAFREELNADAAIQNTGGVRGTLEPGVITERDLLEVSPFGNQMVLARVRGDMLRGLLEDKLRGSAGGLFVSGIRATFDLTRPEGQRILSLDVAGQPLDPTRIYAVATTDYLSEGNSGLDRLRQLAPEDVAPFGATDREVLSRYLRRHGEISPVNDGRWQRVAAP